MCEVMLGSNYSEVMLQRVLKLLKVILIAIFSFSVSYAQDERDFRQMFIRPLLEQQKVTGDSQYHVKVAGPMYTFDLDQDGRNEKIVYVKKDGEDWINIHDYKNKKIFAGRLDSLNLDSRIYKIRIKNISKTSLLLLLYYYEGGVKYINDSNVARLYFLTMDNKDFDTLSLYKGPIYYDELQTNQKRHYHRRLYNTLLWDLDEDGRLDVQVKQHRMSKVFLYRGLGRWHTFRKSVYHY